jgi:hypothetical protein
MRTWRVAVGPISRVVEAYSILDAIAIWRQGHSEMPDRVEQISDMPVLRSSALREVSK